MLGCFTAHGSVRRSEAVRGFAGLCEDGCHGDEAESRGVGAGEGSCQQIRGGGRCRGMRSLLSLLYAAI